MNEFVTELQQGNFSVLNIHIERNGAMVSALQKALQTRYIDDKEIAEFVESANFCDGKWTRFNILVVSFLKYCRDVNPWSLWESLDLVFNFYQDLSNCLLNDNYPLENLVWLFRELTPSIISFALRLDANSKIIGTKEHHFLQFTASIISKVFNGIKPRLEEAATDFEHLSEKQQMLLFVANKLNNIYFTLQSPSSCANIFKNIKPKSMIQHFSQYPIKEQIEYKYMLGRYYLLSHRVSDAHHQLNNAFSLLVACQKATMTPPPALLRNMSKVLQFLVPAGIILGKLPSLPYLQEIAPDLARIYSELTTFLRQGSIVGMNTWLCANEDYLRRKKLLILLLEKLPIIVYRNLFKKVFRLVVLPADSSRVPYETLQKALDFSIAILGPASLIYHQIHTPQNVENVLVTLINHGLLRGNCFPSNKMCVTMKTDNINEIFTSIEARAAAKFPLNQDDSWLDA